MSQPSVKWGMSKNNIHEHRRQVYLLGHSGAVAFFDLDDLNDLSSFFPYLRF
jgi:hypothetical protein